MDNYSQNTAHIDFNQIKLFQAIGEGAYGAVIKGECSGTKVAVKIFKKDKNVDLSKIDEEIKLMRFNAHPNVCLLMGISKDEMGRMALISELADDNLYNIIIVNKKKDIPLIKRLNYAFETAKGMRWLHEKTPKVIHRDLKLENLLIKNGSVKVTDFGLSQFLLDDSVRDVKGLTGTPLFLAPELYSNDEFDEKIDVYSFGIILWQLLERDMPFKNYRSIDELCNGVLDGDRPKFSIEFINNTRYKPLINLIQSCWEHNPNKRPEFKIIEESLIQIMASLSIPCNSQREFWINNIGCYEVEFEKFVDAFLADKSIRTNRMLYDNCVNIIKVCIGERSINIEKFGEFISHHWREDLTVSDVMEEIIELFNHCFHGPLKSADEVESLLGKCEKSYLLRYSSSTPGTFSFSVRYNSKTYHFKTKRKNCGNYTCSIKEKLYSSDKILNLVQEIIENLFPGAQPCKSEKKSFIYVYNNV